MIDHGNGYFVNGLIVVEPGIEYRVEQRHEDEEYEYALVLHGVLHLVCPDVAHVVDSFVDFMK